MSGRHTEFFGADLGRGPFTSTRLETAAVQIAAALAQLRTPLKRSDSDIESHADYIRGLADRLAPDYAAAVAFDVGDESANAIVTSIRTALSARSLLHCWLADSIGGGETSTAPDSVVFNDGVVIETATADKRFLVVTPTTGVLSVTVNYVGDRSWYWATARHGRVFYSPVLNFD